MPAPRVWTPEEQALLGTRPDAELARQLGVGESAISNQRRRLGIPAFVPPIRTCRVCDVKANCRAGFCHTHGERWRCPQCGGWTFGTDPETGQRRCHSDENGQPLSGRYDEQLRPQPGTSPVPCGWQEG